MDEILSPDELARLNSLIDPARAMHASKKIAGQLRERQAAWARGDLSSMSGKMLALAAAALDAQRDRIAALTRDLEETREQLRPGSPTERAPTTDAYERACAAIEKHRAALSSLKARSAGSNRAVQSLMGIARWKRSRGGLVDVSC